MFMEIAFFSLLPLSVRKAHLRKQLSTKHTLTLARKNPLETNKVDSLSFPDSFHRIQKMGDGGDKRPEEVRHVLS